MNRKIVFGLSGVLLSALTICNAATASPVISGLQGTLEHEGRVVVTGSDFGLKSPAKPYFWAPMETSANPSSLGVVTSWAEIASMAFASGEGPGGGGALKSTDSSGVWLARVDASGFSWSDPGQQMYLYRKLKHSFSVFDPVNFNWKSWRVWGNIVGSNQATSVMDGVWNGTFAMDHAVESGQGLWPFSDTQAGFGTVGQWNTNEILMRSNTNGSGYGDGMWEYITNGVVAAHIPYTAYDGIRHLKLWDTTTKPNLQRNYVVHGVKANYTMAPGDQYWASTVYLDNTWSRVIIGNRPTLEASTIREIQIPTAWSANSVEFVVNVRGIPHDTPLYLFVVNSQNIASPGFAISASRPKPPGVLSVD